MSKAAAVSAAEWDKEVVQSEVPVLVDFWAVWCGPCRAIAPHVDALADEFAGKVKVLKVDVDSEQDLAVQHGILTIPQLLFFKDGKEVDRIQRVVPKQVIAESLQRLID